MTHDAPTSLDRLIALVRSQEPGGDALGHLRGAVRLSTHLAEQADHLVGHFVDQARRSGASWSQIGQAMGVTKQAAQQRWVPNWGLDDLATAAPRFDRFTDRARNVLTAANRLAAGAGASTIGAEHIVVGLYSEPQAVAALVLDQLGVGRDMMASALGVTHDPAKDVAALGFSDADTALLDATLREALRLGHNYIGTEHLLLGALASGLPVVEQLAALGITRDAVEPVVLQRLDEILAARTPPS